MLEPPWPPSAVPFLALLRLRVMKKHLEQAALVSIILLALAHLGQALDNEDTTLSSWLAQDTPSHRESILRWSNDFLNSNRSFTDYKYLHNQEISVRWIDHPDIKGLHAEISKEARFRINLNAPYWFTESRLDGTSTPGNLRQTLLHEKYHLFCQTQSDAQKIAVRDLMRTLEEEYSHKGERSLPPHLFRRARNLLTSIEEFHANAYAQKEYQRIYGSVKGRAAELAYRGSMTTALNNWMYQIVDLSRGEVEIFLDLTRRLGFRYDPAIDSTDPQWLDTMIQNIHELPGSEGCLWYSHVGDILR